MLSAKIVKKEGFLLFDKEIDLSQVIIALRSGKPYLLRPSGLPRTYYVPFHSLSKVHIHFKSNICL